MPGRITGKCVLCNEVDAKYRCPKCQIVYCSLGCFKPHRETCATPIIAPKNDDPDDKGNTEDALKVGLNEGDVKLPPLLLGEEEENQDRVPVEILRKLGQSDHLKGLLRNKNLRQMLEEINTTRDQGKAMESAMQVPLFTEFVEDCMSIVEPDEVDKMRQDELNIYNEFSLS